MKSFRLLLTGLFSLLFCLLLNAQDYDLKSTPPLDPAVRSGVLPNGMRYYIRQNKLPEKRAEFYIAHAVGAIQEEDDQNGLAHFTEHMAFNGTANFPGKTMLDYLATIGVKFGQNVNAGTSVEQTVYNLSNVPLLRQGIVDTALLVLHDWSNYISFEDKEIDLERGVILEEWRMYGSADERMSNKLAPVIYKGSKYAKRDVIGDTAVLKHFKYETIRNFYHKWYRPDLQAVIIVGDFDPVAMEKQVIALFSKIPAVKNPAPKVIYPLPDNTEPLIGIAKDKEATETAVQIYFKHDAISNDQKNLSYMRLQLVRNLINSMFAQRMNELSRKENPPFMQAYSYYGRMTKGKDIFTGIAIAENNKADLALASLLTEMYRLRQFGFLESEFERAKANLMRNYESRFMEKDKRKNRELVYPLVSQFLYNQPNPGIEYDYAFVKAMLPGISLKEINAEATRYVRNDNRIITVTGPDMEGVGLPTEQEIKNLLNGISPDKITPWVDDMQGKKLIEQEPVAGKVQKSASQTALGTTEWTLSNGMRVIFKPTEFKEDELMIRASSTGGLSQVKDEDILAAGQLGNLVSQMGIGNFSAVELGKLLAGKRVNVSVMLSDDQDIMNVRTSPKDIETALQLMYLHFTKPRWNEADYRNWYDKLRAMYQNADAEPRKAFYDTLNYVMNNYNPRYKPLTYASLEVLSLESMKRIYADRFQDPSDFTVLFVGKVNPDQVKPIVEKYLASLTGTSRSEQFKDDGARPPKGTTVKDFRRENTTPRTSVFVNYSGKANYSAHDHVMAAAIRHILELRYIESIREKEGGTYSVRTGLSLDKLPEPSYNLNISFDTDPLKADKLIGIVHQEIQNLLQNGPSETDLQKAKEYFIKQRQEDMKENTWWNSILQDFYFRNVDYVNTYEKEVNALTTKDVHAYAKSLFADPDKVSIIMRP